MNVKKTAVTALSVAACLCNYPAWSQSAMPAAASSTQCPSFDPKNLEKNPTVATELQQIAARLVQNYHVAGATATPNEIADNVNVLKGELPVFNLTMLAVVDCTKSSNAAVAQSVTAAQSNTQTGAAPTASGTTSAAQDVGIPQLLGIAVENGAIADSVSGTTMTLSTSPYGFVVAFNRDLDTQQHYQNYAFFTQLGLSSTFNVASTADPLQSASRKAISQWQAKFTFRDTSPRARTVHKFYHDELADAAQALARDLSANGNAQADPLVDAQLQLLIRNWNALLPNIKATIASRKSNDGPGYTSNLQKLSTQIAQLFAADTGFQSNLASALKNKTLITVAQQYGADMSAFSQAYTQFTTAVTNLPKGWNGDVNFSQQFPSPTTTSTSSTTTVSPPAYLAGQFDLTCAPKIDDSTKKSGDQAAPSTGTSKTALASANNQLVPCPLGKHGTITGNFSAGFYPNPKVSLHESTFRGVQDAIQLQWELGGGPFSKLKSADDKSQMTLAFAGNYQRLQENKDLKGKRPDLVTGSIKLSVPISGGASFPVALSFGNATSQVKGNYVAGNFGISLNLDALAALTKLR